MVFEKPFSVMTAALELQERTRHVYPPTESDHTLTSGCWCEPRIEWVDCADGKKGLVIVHNQRQ